MYQRPTPSWQILLVVLSLTACKSSDDSSKPEALMELDPVEVEIEEVAPLPLGPEPRGKPTKFPLVIANGMISDGKTLQPVIDALIADGHKVYLTQVPAAHPVRNRVAALAPQIDQILKETGAEKLNFLAYSLGALDARQLASSMGYGPRVASITSISGVNRGTPAGTAAHRLMTTMPEGWRKKIDAFASMFGAKLVNPLLDNAELTEVAYDISLEGATKFAEANPDVPGIYYQSYAGLSSLRGRPVTDALKACGSILGDGEVQDHMSLALYASMRLLTSEIDRAPSDGAIPVEGQKWGEFRGCAPIDHWGIIGSGRSPGPDEATGFDLVRYYRNIAFDLASKGF